MLKLSIDGVHLGVNSDLEKYVNKKLGKLDRFIPKPMRDSAHAEVFLKESSVKDKKQCTCAVVMHLPKEEYVTKETTINIFAAVDIVEAKLKNQLNKYKAMHEEKRRIFILGRHYLRKSL